MISKTAYNTIIGAIAIAVGVYFAYKMFSYKQYSIEPMTSSSTTDKDKISSAVDGNTDRLGDSLLISKHRSNYEDIILSLEKTIGISIVNEVINNAEIISKDVVAQESMKAITNINQLITFRDSLNQAMTIVDKTK